MPKSMKALHLATIGCLFTLLTFFVSPAFALEDVTYLFPAPPIFPAFGPIQLAKGKGYFEANGLNVDSPSAGAA